MAPDTLRVLVADDHDIVRLGVRHLLGERANVTDAASLNALPRLREEHPALKILVLSSMAEDIFAERVLRAGADGFVSKAALSGVLMQAVGVVMAGGVYASPAIAGALMRRAAGRADAASSSPELSPREVEVLRLVAAGRSTREIADALNRSVKTIETHKQALKTKLGADSPAMLVRLALAWCGEHA